MRVQFDAVVCEFLEKWNQWITMDNDGPRHTRNAKNISTWSNMDEHHFYPFLFGQSVATSWPTSPWHSSWEQQEMTLPSKIATTPQRQPYLRPNWDCATTRDHVTIQNGHRNLSLPHFWFFWLPEGIHLATAMSLRMCHMSVPLYHHGSVTFVQNMRDGPLWWEKWMDVMYHGKH